MDSSRLFVSNLRSGEAEEFFLLKLVVVRTQAYTVEI